MLQGSLPLYSQVKNKLQQEITNHLSPHDQIPSEHDLMENFDVSRTTIRKAIDQLVQEGFLYKKHGKGTFVSEEKIHQQLAQYAGFSQQMEKMGYKVKYEELKKEIIICKNELAMKLEISLGDRVFELERRARRNEEYINLTQSYIPYVYVEGIEKYDFNSHSLYHILEKDYGIKIEQSTRGIEAILADYEIAEILGIKEGMPILKFEGFVTAILNEEKVLMEYFKTYYRTDDTKFFMTQKV